MTETSDPQESDDPLPAAVTCSMLQQREPFTEYVPGGHPGTTPGHPSLTGATPDQDRETMPPQPPRPPQRGSTGPFDDAALRALYGIQATTPSSELVESPPGTPPGRQPERALRRGPPAARRNNRNLCAAAPGARRPRDTDRGRPY